MQMKRVRLSLILALLALSVIGWRAANAGSNGPSPLDVPRGVSTTPTGDTTFGDPDTPQVTKGLLPAPDSDGGRGFGDGWRGYLRMGRLWVSAYLGRWVAR